MKFSNAVAKAERVTGQRAVIRDGKCTIQYDGHRIEFFKNGGGDDPEATCYRTCRDNVHQDTMTDYFPQTFHDNITQCVKFIDRKREREQKANDNSGMDEGNGCGSGPFT